MGLASHLGPWLLGTVKDTTGSTAGTIRNMGATTVAQSKAIAYGDTAATRAFVLPAGSAILRVSLLQTTKFTSGSSGTVKVLLNATEVGSVTVTGSGGSGILALAPTTDAMTALWANIGTTDGVITYTPDTLTAGAGVLVIEYMVRLSDGTYAPTSFTA